MSTSRNLHLSEIVVGGFCTVLGLFVLVDVATTPSIAANSAVGPGAFPAIIGAGLVIIGASLIFQAWTRRSDPAEFPLLDLKAAAFGAAAFALMILTMEWLGWIIAGSLMYLAVATAFGSRQYLKSLGLGVALTTATFLLFDYGLDLSLPAGSLVEGVIALFAPAPAA